MEAAVKFARRWARAEHGEGKTGVVAFDGGFHGRTAGALALTAREDYQAPFRPLMPGVRFAPFDDPEAAAAAVDASTCAVFVEPIQGEGGVRVASDALLAALRAACDRHGALLVFDEIQCGLGRTGRLWAHQHTAVVPDVMVLAKALGGGLPLGATLLTERVAAAVRPGDHGSTFGGGPVPCRAGQVVLRRVSDPGFLARVTATGELLRSRLAERAYPAVREIRGRGLMLGLELDRDAAPLVEAALAAGVLLVTAGPRVLRLLPPLVVGEPEIERLLVVLDGLLGR